MIYKIFFLEYCNKYLPVHTRIFLCADALDSADHLAAHHLVILVYGLLPGRRVSFRCRCGRNVGTSTAPATPTGRYRLRRSAVRAARDLGGKGRLRSRPPITEPGRTATSSRKTMRAGQGHRKTGPKASATTRMTTDDVYRLRTAANASNGSRPLACRNTGFGEVRPVRGEGLRSRQATGIRVRAQTGGVSSTSMIR